MTFNNSWEKIKLLFKMAYAWSKNPFITIIAIIVVIAIIILILMLIGWIISLLWNWLMPSIFSLPKINLWQGLGLYMLSSALFK